MKCSGVRSQRVFLTQFVRNAGYDLNDDRNDPIRAGCDRPAEAGSWKINSIGKQADCKMTRGQPVGLLNAKRFENNLISSHIQSSCANFPLTRRPSFVSRKSNMRSPSVSSVLLRSPPAQICRAYR